MVIALIIILVTAVGILAVLAVVARVLGHPLITRTHVNGSLVDISLWNRKEEESDKEFERRAQSDADGVAGFDIDNAGEADVTGIHRETSGSTEVVRGWDVEKLVCREDLGRVSERCDENQNGEPTVSGCGDGEVFVTTDGIRIITRRPQRGVTAPKRVHGMMTKWNLKYGIFEESEGLWNEEFGSEYKEY
jgi:hypothetical protein